MHVNDCVMVSLLRDPSSNGGKVRPHTVPAIAGIPAFSPPRSISRFAQIRGENLGGGGGGGVYSKLKVYRNDGSFSGFIVTDHSIG